MGMQTWFEDVKLGNKSAKIITDGQKLHEGLLTALLLTRLTYPHTAH